MFARAMAALVIGGLGSNCSLLIDVSAEQRQRETTCVTRRQVYATVFTQIRIILISGYQKE